MCIHGSYNCVKILVNKLCRQTLVTARKWLVGQSNTSKLARRMLCTYLRKFHCASNLERIQPLDYTSKAPLLRVQGTPLYTTELHTTQGGCALHLVCNAERNSTTLDARWCSSLVSHTVALLRALYHTHTHTHTQRERVWGVLLANYWHHGRSEGMCSNYWHRCYDLNKISVFSCCFSSKNDSSQSQITSQLYNHQFFYHSLQYCIYSSLRIMHISTHHKQYCTCIGGKT